MCLTRQKEIKKRGVILQTTEQPINTHSASGKALLDMLGVFAEFTTNLRRERQLAGIAAAKLRGVYRGRKPSINPTEVQPLHTKEHLGAPAITRRLSRRCRCGLPKCTTARCWGSRGLRW